MQRLANRIVHGDNLQVLPTLPDGAFQMVYIDPPFNTGKKQTRRTLKTDADASGDRVGFGGRRYASRLLTESSYLDEFADYFAFLEPRLLEGRRVLASSGTLYFHIDYREAHYCKLLLDQVFGRENFLNEIIWAYDYGARARKRWPAKHDTILVYVKDAERYHFNSAEVDREPYMAPGLATPEKVALGKLPTDVWWHTIVPTNGREKTGYPTQKPEGIVRRMVVASSRPGDMCLDFFAGSGTLGAVAAKTGRGYVLIDANPEAIAVATRRLAAIEGVVSSAQSPSSEREPVAASSTSRSRCGEAGAAILAGASARLCSQSAKQIGLPSQRPDVRPGRYSASDRHGDGHRRPRRLQPGRHGARPQSACLRAPCRMGPSLRRSSGSVTTKPWLVIRSFRPMGTQDACRHSR